jgi:putative transposase
MPSGLKRYHESHQTHFVTFSCYHRLPLLRTAAVCNIFLESLEWTRRRYHLRVYGYVVMPEHVHLLLSEPEDGLLSTAIQALKLASSRRTARFRSAPEPRLWQRRYFDHNVRTVKSFETLLRYTHRNPVKRGLAVKPEDWKWSSFRHYATAEVGVVEIESRWTADRRNGRVLNLLELTSLMSK